MDDLEVGKDESRLDWFVCAIGGNFGTNGVEKMVGKYGDSKTEKFARYG